MPNVAELIKDHVTLSIDCLDRLYLNAYVPRLQTKGGIVGFLLERGNSIPSPALFGQITEAFKKGLRAWCETQQVPWLEFKKGERKDDVVQPYRARFQDSEGVVLAITGAALPSTTTTSTSSTLSGVQASSRSAATLPSRSSSALTAMNGSSVRPTKVAWAGPPWTTAFSVVMTPPLCKPSVTASATRTAKPASSAG